MANASVSNPTWVGGGGRGGPSESLTAYSPKNTKTIKGSFGHKSNKLTHKLTHKQHNPKIHNVAHTIKIAQNPSVSIKKTRRNIKT